MMSYVNTVSIVNNECSNFKGETIASSCSPGTINICDTVPSSNCNNKGTTYIRVYNDGKKIE